MNSSHLPPIKAMGFPKYRDNTLYKWLYLLGALIAWPLIAKRQIKIANMVGADAVCHSAIP